MALTLPSNPSLENLKKQAKSLRKAWSAGAPEAISRIRAAHPRYSELSDEQLRATKPRLTDCQLVLAREAGYQSWQQLKVNAQSANQELADQFLELACLCYDDPHYDHRSFHARAHAMLSDKPWLSEINIWCAAAAGHAGAVRLFLDRQPDLVNFARLHGWTPLICACYSRVKPLDPSHSTYRVAQLLLDRGADPNAYTLKHNDPPGSDRARRFTALTGVLGGGSTGFANQPPHSQRAEMAELLLAHGANPVDEQALNVNQDACLELLLRYGLKPDAMGPRGITLMGRALCQAARHGDVAAVRLLLAHGVRKDEKFQGKSAWEHAMRLGQLEVARLLEEAGATVSELDDAGRFISLCMAGDEPGVRAMLESHLDLIAGAPKDIVHRAVWTKRRAAVKLVLELGFDPNFQDDNAAIHMAGVLAEDQEILRLLLAHGASLELRDPWYDGTAIEWADFFNFIELRDRLLNEPGICLFDALDHDRLDRIPDILARDPAALERPFAKCLSREPKTEDWQTPLVRMIVRGKTAAARILLDSGADPEARHPDGRSLLQVARDQGLGAIAELLKATGCSE